FTWDSFTYYLYFLISPILIAACVNFIIFRFFEKYYYQKMTTSSAKNKILFFHIILVLFITYHTNFIKEFQSVSGFYGPAVDKNYYFSTALRLVGFGWLNVVAILSVLVLFIGGLFLRILFTKNFPEFKDSVLFWYRIGAIGEYQPHYGSETVYVNVASMAPSIRSVEATRTKYHDDYQRRVPTSQNARDLLFHNANEARDYLKEYLFSKDQTLRNAFKIEFFTGTSRALEAGILRLKDISHIVLSPYEHPSQIDVVNWLVRRPASNITCSSLRPSGPDFFQAQWQDQMKSVCERIRNDTKDRSGKIAIVLSEVHFITGIQIKVEEIISELNRTNKNFIFIIDGSQAVGNLECPFQEFHEQLLPQGFYYFSAHKWLLSPNTCGVLISPIHAEDAIGIQPYDMFGNALPNSTIDPNTIFGISSSLKYLFDNENLFKKFWKISNLLKQDFKTELEKANSNLMTIESTTPSLNSSLFLAIEPKNGFQWKFAEDDFWTDLRKSGIDLTFIPKTNFPKKNPYFENELNDSKSYCLRISFPYFLAGKNIKDLAKHLNKLTERSNRN
ncbi:MAG: aminotransferase class V-fold PLP-dependent enzyme, partial [Bacteroidota bacterium]|nr:aminotransferase class V-fold PLP-dependent enzyme [Bacteroidota bacterium]